MLIATIGFSGPRLTPPPRPMTTTSARPGSTDDGSGGDTSDWSPDPAGVPGTRHMSNPVTNPTNVSIPMIQNASPPSRPYVPGNVSHNRSSSPRPPR